MRPTQGVNSVIRVSPNSHSHSWKPTLTEQQQSVILQHALNNTVNNENEPTKHIATSKAFFFSFRYFYARNVCVIIIVFVDILGTLYCVLPQPQDKNVMVINTQIIHDRCKTPQSHLNQVRYNSISMNVYIAALCEIIVTL